MASTVVYKTPGEVISYGDADFTGLLPSTDSTLDAGGSSVTAVASDGTADNSVVANVTRSGLVLTSDLRAGTDGEDYSVTFRGKGGTSGKIRDILVELRIRSKVTGPM